MKNVKFYDLGQKTSIQVLRKWLAKSSDRNDNSKVEFNIRVSLLM